MGTDGLDYVHQQQIKPNHLVRAEMALNTHNQPYQSTQKEFETPKTLHDLPKDMQVIGPEMCFKTQIL